MVHRISIDGISYESAPEEVPGACAGCIADENQTLCSIIEDVSDDAEILDCSLGHMIWKRADVPVAPVTRIYNGITYRRVREQLLGRCNGCAAAVTPGNGPRTPEQENLCPNLNRDDECRITHSIWVLDNPVPETTETPVQAFKRRLDEAIIDLKEVIDFQADDLNKTTLEKVSGILGETKRLLERR